MLNQETVIDVEDCIPRVDAITRTAAGATITHLRLVPRGTNGERCCVFKFRGLNSAFRDFIGELGLALAEAEQQALAEAANGEPAPIEIEVSGFGEVAGL